MITAKDFLAYVEETTRNELWIDHAAWYLGKDVYITAGVSINYPPYYRFYIRNVKVERLYSVQEYILELWTVDPKVTKPFYEVYSVAGEMGFGWWLVEHYLSYHVNRPDGCGLGEPTRGR